MKVQEEKEKLRLQEWSGQIKAREESGMSVKDWCAANGPSAKTYYIRLKRVREEALDIALPQVTTGVMNARLIDGEPIFAALPMPQSKGAAVTVWLGKHAVDIQNGADSSVIEQVLKAVSQL
jgi:hypothetical protein